MSFKQIAFFISFIIAGSASAQNWTGTVDADWNNASNWSSWPLNGQGVTIDPTLYTGNAASPVISSNSVFTPSTILIQNGATLTIAANLTTTDNIEVIGNGTHLQMNAGTLNVNPGNGGRLVIDLGATMMMDGGSVLVDERFIAGEDAVITINNGTASSGQRLLMDLGGHFIQNGGIVSVAQTMAMADGSVNNHSGYELNGGTLNVTGEMALENEAGNFRPFFVQDSGILNLNGNLVWFGASPGSGTPEVVFNGGTASK